LDPVFSQPRELLTVVRHEASANRAFHRALALLERGRSAAGTARASRRQGGRLDKIVYEKGTQFPDARPAPNPLAPLASSRFDRSPRLSRDAAANPPKPAKTISGRPESPLIQDGYRSSMAARARSAAAEKSATRGAKSALPSRMASISRRLEHSSSEQPRLPE
jgi:hypothetical protein